MEEVAEPQLSLPRGQEESGGKRLQSQGWMQIQALLPSRSHCGIPQHCTHQIHTGPRGMRGYQGM